MKVYGFFAVNDSSKDIIAKCKLNNLNDAIIHFARIKNLPPEEFIKIYCVTDEI